MIHEALESHANIDLTCVNSIMYVDIFCAHPPNVRLTTVLTLVLTRYPGVVELTRNLESESKLRSHKTRFTSRGARCNLGALTLIARQDPMIYRQTGVPYLPLSDVIKVDHPFMGQGLSQCL